MTIPVLICDDSKFARTQMARSIPAGWDVEIHHAEHGAEALDLIKAGKGDVMFLDLNMPVMDGYQTMEAIRREDLPTMVIVVSGDVQPEARERMMAMGALDFIRKPIDNAKLVDILDKYGIYKGDPTALKPSVPKPTEQEPDRLDAYREIANIAMGQAGEKLANLLGAFIKLPIPNVNLIESSELRMAVAEVQQKTSISAVSQGFISAGVNGEALIIFNEANIDELARLLKYTSLDDEEERGMEVLMDVSNIITGACLNALAEQLHLQFSRSHPMVLGRHCDIEELIEANVSRWNRVVAIEIAYSLEDHDVQFDLLLLFPNAAMENVLEIVLSAQEEEA